MLISSDHYLVAYGSLLSIHSRQHFSGVTAPTLPVSVRGWRRAWITRSSGERQTYVGALADNNGMFNAAIIPVSLNPSLHKREQDYEFVAVAHEQLELHVDEAHHASISGRLRDAKVWICQSREAQLAEWDFPIYQSYVDTCLSGCLESGVEDFAARFVQSTAHWDTHLVNDRAAPKYPRAAPLKPDFARMIDEVMEKFGVEHHHVNMD
ncbi:hypothetical protein [Aestuariibacter salexigens]|uniref:hypothetical protein n=1 Tax=Aestuariibacter salexigens TaxID=226010 RepID=UPI0003F576AA|nr:hypothetical protein [Aestuariibacter salexigens]